MLVDSSEGEYIIIAESYEIKVGRYLLRQGAFFISIQVVLYFPKIILIQK